MNARIVGSSETKSELRREPVVFFSMVFGLLLFAGFLSSGVWYFLPQRNLESGAKYYQEEEYSDALERLTRALMFGFLGEEDAAHATYMRGISYWHLSQPAAAHGDLTVALDSGYLNRDEISAGHFVRGEIWYDYEYYDVASLMIEGFTEPGLYSCGN